MPRILITRERADSIKTAKLFTSVGISAVILPLITIEPVALVSIPKLEEYCLVATSASAFKYLPTIAPGDLYCVGEHTASIAMKYGLAKQLHIYRDAEDLIRHFPAKPNPILYLCGEPRRQLLEEYFAKQNYLYWVVQTYKSLINQKLLDYVTKGEITLPYLDFILVTSQSNAELLNQIHANINYDAKFVCFSARIAEKLNHKHIFVAEAPNMNSIIKLVTSFIKN